MSLNVLHYIVLANLTMSMRSMTTPTSVVPLKLEKGCKGHIIIDLVPPNRAHKYKIRHGRKKSSRTMAHLTLIARASDGLPLSASIVNEEVEIQLDNTVCSAVVGTSMPLVT